MKIPPADEDRKEFDKGVIYGIDLCVKQIDKAYKNIENKTPFGKLWTEVDKINPLAERLLVLRDRYKQRRS